MCASHPGPGTRLGGFGYGGSGMGAGFRRAGDMGAGLGPGLKGLAAGFSRVDSSLYSGLTGLGHSLTLLFRQRPAVAGDPA